MHENSVEFKAWSDYALFSDPITRVGGEKYSYMIPTYEAIKGILQSVYWKPTFTWVIDKVRVMNSIQMETKGIRPIKYSENKNDLSYYTYLTKVEYQVKAHFIWNENRPELACDRNENKHHNIAKRMIKKGGRRDIFLGTRECQGYVEPCVFGEGEGYYDNCPQLDFGVMYNGITYADEAYSEETTGKMTVRLWRPVMKNGVIEFLKPDSSFIEKGGIERYVRDMPMKKFGVDLDNFQPVDQTEREWADVTDDVSGSDL